MDEKEIQELRNALNRAKVNLNSSVEERQSLEEQLSRVTRDIKNWHRVVEAISAVLEDSTAELPPAILLPEVPNEPFKHLRFTDAVREVLRQSGNIPISAPQIRDQLIKMGFDFDKYKQELVPVHNTLKRLEEQGEVEPIRNGEGQTIAYVRVDPVQRAVAEATAHFKQWADKKIYGKRDK